MRSVVPMKTAKIGYLVISVLFCVLGIVLIAAPGTSVVWLGRLLGIGMIVFGAIKLVGYFSRDLFRLAFQYDLAFGILLIALGIVTLARPGGAMSFLCIVFGIPVLADGLFKIQISLDAKRFGIEKWWVVLLLAALTCVIGLLLVIRPSEAARALMVLMGISLLLDGILNICVAWLCVKIVRNQRPDALDEDYEELTCSLEYLTSWLMEKLFHARWWDYSKRKFNIGGRVCLIGAVVFGAFSVVLVLVLHPFVKSLTDRLTDAALNWICAILFVGIVSDLVVTVKGLLGTHAVFAEYAVLLQQKRKELADRLRTGATEGRERILAATQEEREKLREAAAYGEEERERIRRDTEEERDRFYAKLQMRLNAQQRRTIYSFPHLTLTRNNEVLDGLRQNMEKVRQRAKKTS